MSRAWVERLRDLPTAFKSSRAKNNTPSSGNWGRIVSVVGNRYANLWPDLSKYAEQARAYGRSSWVYIAVDRKATAGALVNLNVMHYVNEKKTGIPNHPLEQLLRKPNAYQTQLRFMYATIAFQELTGNVYWFLNYEGSTDGTPTEMMILRPDRMRIVPGPDSKTRVKGYIYTVDGIEIPLAPEEVFHFALFNPGDDYYGMSRLEAASLAVSTDVSMQQWNANHFGKNNAIPAGIVNVAANTNDADYERLMTEWMENYGGGQNKTAIVRGDAIKWTDIGKAQRDMEFSVGRQFNKEEVFQIFGIPPGLLDKNSTEANANAAGELFTQNTVWPMMVDLAQAVTLRLAPLYGDDLIVEPDDIRKKDTAAERAEMQAYGALMTINEGRERYLDMEPVPWGDIPASGAGAVAITGQALPTNPNAAIKPDEIRRSPADDKIAAQEEKAESATKSLGAGDTPLLPSGIDLPVRRTHITREIRDEMRRFATKASKGKNIEDFVFHDAPVSIQIGLKALVDAAFINEYEEFGFKSTAGDPRLKTEKKLLAATKEYFSGLQQRLIKGVRHVNSTKSLPDVSKFLAYFNGAWWRNEDGILQGLLLPIINDAVIDQALLAADAVESELQIGFDPAVFHDTAAQWALNYTDTVLKNFRTTTQKGVGAMLTRYIQQSDATLDDLVSAIQDSYLFSDARARVVAITETSRAMGAGEYLAGEEMANIANVDVRLTLNQFGDLVPAHVNCRCRVNLTFIYGADHAIIGVDYIWQTIEDERVCPICGRRDGKYVSELVGEAA